MNNELTTIVVKIIFAILSTAITFYLIPFLKSLAKRSQNEEFIKFIKVAVLAAEQVLNEPGSGAKKKELVMTEASKWLKEHNISISEAELDNMIEAIVFAMNNAKEELLND